MLFPSKEAREQHLAIGRALEAGTIGEAEAGERLLKLDPDSGAAYLALGKARLAAGDLSEAESLFWQGLDRKPCVYALYIALSDVRRLRDPDDPLATGLRMLGVWKLSFSDEIPDAVADSFRRSKGLDFKDPKTYEMLATAYEVQQKDTVDTPEVQARLLPYRLLNDLQRQAPTVVADHLLQEILANSERCLPLWRAALREWGKNPGVVSTKALALIVAVLGEIGGADVLDDLLDLATFHDDVIFLHTHWAIWRIGQRLPSETLAKFRAVTQSAPLARRCGLAEQINLLPELDGKAPALMALLEGFSSFVDNPDAPYLLMVVVDALAGLGLDEEAQQALDRYQRVLTKKGRTALQALIDEEGGFLPKLVEEEIDLLDIEDVSIRRVLMADEDDEDEEEDESHEEEPFAPAAQRAKPGRNDPCWCGSGKKYKKCHLAADEAAERSGRKSEPQEPGDRFYQTLVHQVFDSAPEIRSRAELLEAYRLYFDQHPSDVDDQTANESGFFEWYIHDFRPGGTGRTLVEEYLRRRGARLSQRERVLLESWLAARYGLFEIQRIEKGTGAELKDLFASDRFFVHDVSTSRSAAPWDCILTRVQDYEGRRIFTGNGVIVARPLLSRFVSIVEEESRAARQPPAEFLRANSHRWYQVLAKLHDEQIAGLQMVNAEGDPIEFCSATYRVRDEEGLLAGLAAVEAFEETTDKDDPPGVRFFGWLEPGVEGPRRSYGHIEIRDGRLRLECNSRRRLRTGRQLLEKNARAFLKHEGDSFESVSEASERLSREGPKEKPATGIPPEVERELLLRFKTEHYAKWPDESLPALGGKTPRQAVKSEVGRRAVEDLIRQFENSEGRREDGQPPFDFSPLRKTLGLDR